MLPVTRITAVVTPNSFSLLNSAVADKSRAVVSQWKRREPASLTFSTLIKLTLGTDMLSIRGAVVSHMKVFKN
jgi:hypothetical protein